MDKLLQEALLSKNNRYLIKWNKEAFKQVNAMTTKVIAVEYVEGSGMKNDPMVAMVAFFTLNGEPIGKIQNRKHLSVYSWDEEIEEEKYMEEQEKTVIDHKVISKIELYMNITSKLEYSRKMWRGNLQPIRVCPFCGAVDPNDYKNIILKEKHPFKTPQDYRTGHLSFCEYSLLNNMS